MDIEPVTLLLRPHILNQLSHLAARIAKDLIDYVQSVNFTNENLMPRNGGIFKNLFFEQKLMSVDGRQITSWENEKENTFQYQFLKLLLSLLFTDFLFSPTLCF